MSFSANTHIEHQLYREQWEANKDASRNLVKQAKQKYLPMNDLPDSALTTPENVQMNEYIKHKYNTQIWPMSVFYNFTRPTIGAWSGLIMAKKPTIKLSDDETSPIDYVYKNADGGGNDIKTVARIALEASIETGGGCIYVEPPMGQMTIQSVRDGSVAPFMRQYDRDNILDWETKFIDGNKQLVYIKLREYETRSGEVSSIRIEKHIELFLKDGAVSYSVTRDFGNDDMPDEEGFVEVDGQALKSIPVFWFGASNNDESVDPAPVTPIAALNILHYQLYSRHIHQCWDAGQAQYHIDHGTQSEVQVHDEKGNTVSIVDYLNPGGIKIGTSAAIHTINGGSVEVLQTKTDSLLGEEPGKIEERAQKIGAQMLIESSTTTATEANLTYGASTSNLVTIADNVGMAIQQALKLIAEWVKHDPEQVAFELNKKLVTSVMSAQDIQAAMQSVMQGAMPVKAFYWQLQQAGKIPSEWSYDDFIDELNESDGLLNLAGTGRQV